MYVMLVIYTALVAQGSGTTRVHQEFNSMQECQRVLQDYRASLGSKLINGQCYYKSANPLPGDCKSLQQFSFKWTATCSKPGNELMRQCQFLENPTSPYDKCGEKK